MTGPGLQKRKQSEPERFAFLAGTAPAQYLNCTRIGRKMVEPPGE